MKTSFLTAGILAAGAMFCAPGLMSASAQGVFISGGYTSFDNNTPGDDSLGGATGRVGIFVLGIGAEVEGSVGVKDAGSTELDSNIAAFGVWKAITLVNVNLFVRAGVSRIELSPTYEDDGPAYGVGGEFFLTPNDGVRIDLTRHDFDAGEVDAIGISYVRKL